MTAPLYVNYPCCRHCTWCDNSHGFPCPHGCNNPDPASPPAGAGTTEPK